MEKQERNSNVEIKIAGVILVLIIIVIGIILALLFSGTEQLESSGGNVSEKQAAMSCKTSENMDAVFYVKDAENPKHIITVFYDNDKPERISYDFETLLGNNDRAEQVMTSLHIDFNEYMSNHHVERVPTSNFNNAGTRVVINLYSDFKDVSTIISKYFLLAPEDVANISSVKVDDLKQIYESKGFTCEMK